MNRRFRRNPTAAAGLVAVLALRGATACSREGGDGAVTHAGGGELDDQAARNGPELQQELNEGEEEAPGWAPWPTSPSGAPPPAPTRTATAPSPTRRSASSTTRQRTPATSSSRR